MPGHGDGGPTLEIFTYGRMDSSGGIMANHQGYAHIAFEVDNVRATHKLAMENGGETLGEGREK